MDFSDGVSLANPIFGPPEPTRRPDANGHSLLRPYLSNRFLPTTQHETGRLTRELENMMDFSDVVSLANPTFGPPAPTGWFDANGHSLLRPNLSNRFLPTTQHAIGRSDPLLRSYASSPCHPTAQLAISVHPVSVPDTAESCSATPFLEQQGDTSSAVLKLPVPNKLSLPGAVARYSTETENPDAESLQRNARAQSCSTPRSRSRPRAPSTPHSQAHARPSRLVMDMTLAQEIENRMIQQQNQMCVQDKENGIVVVTKTAFSNVRGGVVTRHNPPSEVSHNHIRNRIVWLVFVGLCVVTEIITAVLASYTPDYYPFGLSQGRTSIGWFLKLAYWVVILLMIGKMLLRKHTNCHDTEMTLGYLGLCAINLTATLFVSTGASYTIGQQWALFASNGQTVIQLMFLSVGIQLCYFLILLGTAKQAHFAQARHLYKIDLYAIQQSLQDLDKVKKEYDVFFADRVRPVGRRASVQLKFDAKQQTLVPDGQSNNPKRKARIAKAFKRAVKKRKASVVKGNKALDLVAAAERDLQHQSLQSLPQQQPLSQPLSQPLPAEQCYYLPA